MEVWLHLKTIKHNQHSPQEFLCQQQHVFVHLCAAPSPLQLFHHVVLPCGLVQERQLQWVCPQNVQTSFPLYHWVLPQWHVLCHTRGSEVHCCEGPSWSVHIQEAEGSLMTLHTVQPLCKLLHSHNTSHEGIKQISNEPDVKKEKK